MVRAINELESFSTQWRLGALLMLLLAFGISALSSRAEAIEPGSTVIPTDVEPLPNKVTSTSNSRAFTSTLQMRLWQHLPAHLFFSTSVETTMRIETNPFQFPLKRTFMKQNMPPGTDFLSLSPADQFTFTSDLSQIGAFDNVHRITPNGTVGWSLSPNTQVFANAFFLRDSLMHNYPLNTSTGAFGLGAQHIISINSKVSLQPQYIIRELWQSQQVPVLDHLPGLTAQYNATPNLNLYANALLQVRFAHFIDSYMRELDPFYTWGGSYQRGQWTFLMSSTFLQNFRTPFSKALVRRNNYSEVCDFELDRPIFRNMPNVVTVVRAEPVYNFHSHATPGLAGMDFRFYYGVRITAAKPALNDTMQQLRQRYLNQPNQPNQPSINPSYAPPEEIRKAIMLDSEQPEDPETHPLTCLTLHGTLTN